MNRKSLILAFACLCSVALRAQSALLIDASSMALTSELQFPCGLGIVVQNSGIKQNGLYVTVNIQDEKGLSIILGKSERFNVDTGRFDLLKRETLFNLQKFQESALKSVNGDKLILHDGKYKVDVLLMKYEEHAEIILARDKIILELTDSSWTQFKKPFKYPVYLPTLGPGSLTYEVRKSNQQMFGEQRPLLYQYLVLNTGFTLAGIPLKSRITMTDGNWQFRQNPLVFGIQFDSEEFRRRIERRKSELSAKGENEYKGKLEELDSLFRVLEGLDKILDQPGFARQLDRIKQLDSIDSSLLEIKDPSDTLMMDSLIQQRVQLSDSIPNARYIRKMLAIKNHIDSLKPVYHQLKALSGKGGDLSIPDSINGLPDSLSGKSSAIQNQILQVASRIEDLGVGTVFHSVNKYSIDGSPINGGKFRYRTRNEVHYTVATGKIARTTMPSLEHDERINTWLTLVGIERKIGRGEVKLYYIYAWEKDDSVKRVVGMNHVVPVEFKMDLGSNFYFQGDLSLSHYRKKYTDNFVFNALKESQLDSMGLRVQNWNTADVGLAGELTFGCHLGKSIDVEYSAEHLTRNYTSLAQPYLMTGITNQELNFKWRIYKKYVQMKAGAVYSVKHQENAMYKRIQPKVKVMAKFPGWPIVIMQYIPTFIKTDLSEYNSGLINVNANYEHKYKRVLFSESATYSQMILINGSVLNRLTQQVYSLSLSRKNIQTQLSFCDQVSDGHGSENMRSSFVQSDVIWQFREWLSIRGQGQFDLGGNSKKGYGVGVDFNYKQCSLGLFYQNQVTRLYDPSQIYYVNNNVYSFTLKTSIRW